MPNLAIRMPSSLRRRRHGALADWLGWLALVVLLAALGAVSPLGPSGSRSAARLNLSSGARLVLVLAVVIGGYLILRA
jgi:hypothetical protein